MHHTASSCLFALQITCSALGISPLVFRIGKALWRRKIAIIGNEQVFSSLKECIGDSGIFHDKNIIHIPLDNLDKTKEQSLLLVDWETSGDQIDQIFQNRKSHQTAVIILQKPVQFLLKKCLKSPTNRIPWLSMQKDGY
jgi:hypothetical protein